MKNLGINVVSKACGIQAHTLRVWEQRYGVFCPSRDKNGKRLYGVDDLEKAKSLAKLIDYGHTISAIANLSVSEMNKMVSLTTQNQQIINLQSKIQYETQFKISRVIKLLSNFSIDEVVEELKYIRLSTSAKEFVLDIVIPIMREIGVLCLKGKLSTTQEHILSTIIRDQLSQIYLPNLGGKSDEVALATPDGNLHELSIIIADILCRSNRISTRYLGASHPPLCLAEAMNALKTPILVLGVLSSDKWDYSKSMISYLTQIDKHLKFRIKVILGGGNDQDFPEFRNITQVLVMKSFDDFDKHLGEMI
jgi:DNA-binding transcriptional MerR regulator